MTYSLSVSGYSNQHQQLAVENLTLDDATNISWGAEQRGAQLGTAVLCRRPDLSQALYAFDPDRWTAMAGPIATGLGGAQQPLGTGLATGPVMRKL